MAEKDAFVKELYFVTTTVVDCKRLRIYTIVVFSFVRTFAP